MKNRAFVEFIFEIRGAYLFLHIVNKRFAPMRTKIRTSRSEQTFRDIAFAGDTAGTGAVAEMAAQPETPRTAGTAGRIHLRTTWDTMKKHLIYLMTSAALLAVGCSTENKTEGAGYGSLEIVCTTDPSIDSALSPAETPGTAEVPEPSTFSLTVTGEAGTQTWDTLAAFEQSESVFRMGSYTVVIAHGDPEAEGVGKPYYAAGKAVEIRPRQTENVELTATIANSQVVVRATEQFLAYFHDAKFTVTTASGNAFDFTPGTTPAAEPVFVKAATKLTITGSARRQSPTGTGEGPEVTFGEQTLDATAPRTCHVLTFDAKNAGSATLEITLGDSYTETLPLDWEVNEGAIPDKE